MASCTHPVDPMHSSGCCAIDQSFLDPPGQLISHTMIVS
jgi:hypothetical protein